MSKTISSKQRRKSSREEELAFQPHQFMEIQSPGDPRSLRGLDNATNPRRIREIIDVGYASSRKPQQP